MQLNRCQGGEKVVRSGGHEPARPQAPPCMPCQFSCAIQTVFACRVRCGAAARAVHMWGQECVELLEVQPTVQDQEMRLAAHVMPRQSTRAGLYTGPGESWASREAAHGSNSSKKREGGPHADARKPSNTRTRTTRFMHRKYIMEFQSASSRCQ